MSKIAHYISINEVFDSVSPHYYSPGINRAKKRNVWTTTTTDRTLGPRLFEEYLTPRQ